MTTVHNDDLVAVVEDAGSDVSDGTRGPARGVRAALARVRRTDAAKGRLWHLDAARGLAVALMVLDHVLLWHHAAQPLRLTVTRASMPLFFLLSGMLVRRLTWRHAAIFGVGLALPAVVPWIDNPNVLVWYAAGALLLVQLRRIGWSRYGYPLLVALPLVMFANGLDPVGHADTYQPYALWGLMAFGAMLPAEAFGWARRLPSWLGWLGRYPLSFYVGHLLVIEGFLIWWRS